MKNVRFKDLANNSELNYLSNNKEMLKANEMASILGGAGCESQICANKRAFGVEQFCPGDIGACVSGLGVCTQKTDMIMPIDPPKPIDNILVPGILDGDSNSYHTP